MRTMKEIFGYLLGGLLFVGLIPAFMWLLSGMPAFLPENWVRLVASVLLAIVGLTVSVWSIVHMRRRGNGNPMDAFGHEVAPRTSRQ